MTTLGVALLRENRRRARAVKRRGRPYAIGRAVSSERRAEAGQFRRSHDDALREEPLPDLALRKFGVLEVVRATVEAAGCFVEIAGSRWGLTS